VICGDADKPEFTKVVRAFSFVRQAVFHPDALIAIVGCQHDAH
jgi:hypothetical protein